MYVCPPQARVETAASVMERVGPRALMVPSSNHPDIMAGQGTIATEFLQQVYAHRVIYRDIECRE